MLLIQRTQTYRNNNCPEVVASLACLSLIAKPIHIFISSYTQVRFYTIQIKRCVCKKTILTVWKNLIVKTPFDIVKREDANICTI